MAGVASIGQASGENVLSLGQQAWNISDGYTKIKILSLTIEIDVYEKVAMFGKQYQEEDIHPDNIPSRRAEALERVLFDLRQLIGNCRFSIDKKKDEIVVGALMQRLDMVERHMVNAWQVFEDFVRGETKIQINEPHFRLCFDILRNIKDELNFPMNRNGLIFRQSDEIDLDKIMHDIAEGS